MCVHQKIFLETKKGNHQMREIFIKHHYKGSYPGNGNNFKSIKRKKKPTEKNMQKI